VFGSQINRKSIIKMFGYCNLSNPTGSLSGKIATDGCIPCFIFDEMYGVTISNYPIFAVISRGDNIVLDARYAPRCPLKHLSDWSTMEMDEESGEMWYLDFYSVVVVGNMINREITKRIRRG